MLKKSIGISLLSLCMAAPAHAWIGPYVGAGLGITANTATSSQYGSFRGVPASIFIGFAGDMNQFYLGGELTGVLATGDLSDQGSVRTSYGFGGSLTPGFYLSDHTLALMRLGVVRTHFPQVRVPTANNSHDQTGGEIGFGLQTALTQNIDMRGEYDFIAYRAIDARGYSVKPRSDVATVSLIYKF